MRSGDDTKYETPELNNMPKAITYPGGGNATVEYDNLGRVTEQSSSHDGQDYEESEIVYDAYDRVRSVEYTQGPGGANTATFGYDLMGPLTSADYDELNEQYPVTYTIDTDGTYKSVTYPSETTVNEFRQTSGRLFKTADDQGAILEVISFKGANLPLQTRLGANIVELNDWDQRRRLLSRRYTAGSTNGPMLADLRYAYDAGFNPVARQFVHRHGRADLFQFDDADRLDFFEHGARPAIEIAGARSADGLQGGSGLAKGFYARDYIYGNSALDLLTEATLFNPDGLARQGQGALAFFGPVVPAFAATLLGHDTGFKLALEVDGFNFEAPDGLGNAKESRLFVRPGTPNAPDSSPVEVEFFHNARNDLVRVERTDGLEIEFQYQPGGLMHHRTVRQGASTVSSTHFVWDRARLIEEWDTRGAQKELRARYFYADSDAPVAADLPDGLGGTLRHFYLRDHAESVIAVANAQGQVVERVHYDAWGQPAIEALDTSPPVVSLVRLNGNVLIVAFSETVMPPLTVPEEGLATETSDPSTLITIASALGQANVTAVYQENEPGFVFGSVLRLTVSPPLTGANQLTIQAGAFSDEWGNPNQAISLPLNTAEPTAPILHEGPAQGSTAGRKVARSSVDNPFLFHGQYFDYDTGLIYMRARWYDPFTGHFIERDPMQYEDSPNLYAGFGNNPVSYRDPTGMARRRAPSGGRDEIGDSSIVRANGPRVGLISTQRPRRPMNSDEALPTPIPPPRSQGKAYGGFADTPIAEEEVANLPKLGSPDGRPGATRQPGMKVVKEGWPDDEPTSPGRRRPAANNSPAENTALPSGRHNEDIAPMANRPDPDAASGSEAPVAIKPPMKPAPPVQKPAPSTTPNQPATQKPASTGPSKPDPGQARRQASIDRADKLAKEHIARADAKAAAEAQQRGVDYMEEAHGDVKRGEAEARAERGGLKKAVKFFKKLF